MPLPALIILIVSVASLLAVVGWLMFARHWRYPKGKRFPAVYQDIDVKVIASQAALDETDADMAALAVSCAKAVWATRKAWLIEFKDDVEPAQALKSVVVLINTNEEFEGVGWRKERLVKAAATLGHVQRVVGLGSLPMPIIRGKYISEIQTSGEPVIHELLHELIISSSADGSTLYDYAHQNPRCWAAAGGDLSAQSAAQKIFRSL